VYEFVILAHLMRGPMHGYLIAKIINDMNGPYIRVSNGTIYPAFAKLEQQGLIAVETSFPASQAGDREPRVYRITEAGRQRFSDLMLDTNSHQKAYQETFLQKTGFFAFITLEERLRLIDHYIHYCQGHILYEQAEIDDLLKRVKASEQTGWKREDMVGAMQHILERWQLELAWAQRLREQCLASEPTQKVSETPHKEP
jgi:DNA-binding PadR family transcriptional regulator